VHEQLLYTHSSGNTDTKPSWLDSMKSGRTKYKAANCSDRKVRVFGDVALITGRAAIEAEIGGQPRSLKLLFLNAWTKTPASHGPKGSFVRNSEGKRSSPSPKPHAQPRFYIRAVHPVR
jgi:Domain of unknown function (DUF4440)